MVNEHTTQLRRSGPSPPSAFTLIEMVVVISIMALLVGVAIPVVGASLRISGVSKTKDTMKALAEGIENFYQDTDEFPVELKELIAIEGNMSGWSGPYVNEGFSGTKGNIFYDEWQNAFEYIDVDASTKRLRSWGFNGKDEEGGGDDIDFDVDVTSLLRRKNQKLLDEINAAIQVYNAAYRIISLPVLHDTGNVQNNGYGHWHTHQYVYDGKWTSITHKHKLKNIHSMKDLYKNNEGKQKVAHGPSVFDIPLMSPWSYTLDLLELRSLLNNTDKRYDKDAWGNSFVPGPDPVQYVTSSRQ